MARLETGPARSAASGARVTGWWKIIALVAVIGGVWGYFGYKYVQYRVPQRTTASSSARKPAARAPKASGARAQRPGGSQQFLAMLKDLNLTDEQKSQIDKIAAETTVPRTLRARVNKILTPEQRAALAEKQKELAAKRAEQQKARAEKNQKLYGADAQYAQQADAAIRAQREARRMAAAAADSTTASKTP